MAEVTTAATNLMNPDDAPWMVALAEQQKTIQRLMERIELLEGRKSDPQSSAHSTPSSVGQTLAAQTSDETSGPVENLTNASPWAAAPAYSSPTPNWNPVGQSSNARSQHSNTSRSQSTYNSSSTSASATGRGSGRVSSAASVSGDTSTSQTSARKGRLSEQVCRYGSNCTREKCWFQHPNSEQTGPNTSADTTTQSTNRNKKPCHRAMSCLRADCRFEHPAGWDPSGAATETPVAPSWSEPPPQQTVDDWAPSNDSTEWGSAPNLSSWAETPNNDWGTPSSDWGAPPAPDNSRGTTGNQKSDNLAQSKWGESTSTGWGPDKRGDFDTVTSQGSATPQPGSSSRGKKGPGAKRRETERRARRNAEKEAQPASETATTTTDALSDRAASVFTVEPTGQPINEFSPEHTDELTNEHTGPLPDDHEEEPAEPAEPASESTSEPMDEPAEYHESTDLAPAAAETSDTQETPSLDPPSAPSSESEMPETPDRLVWSDEPQADFPIVDFADLPSSHGLTSEYTEDVDAENGYEPYEEEAEKAEPNLENTQSMIYTSWENVAPSAADWGFDTSGCDWATPAPAPAPAPTPVEVNPVPEVKPVSAKKTVVKSKGKHKAAERASSAFNFQPQNIGAPGSSSHQPVSQARPPPPLPVAPPTEAPPVVAPEPPKGVPDDQIPDWLLGGGMDAHQVLGISRPATPEPSTSSTPSVATPRPSGPPKISQMAGNRFPGLGEPITVRPLQSTKTAAPKPTVRARPVGWKIVPSTDPPGTSSWATGSGTNSPKPKARTVRPKGKRQPTDSSQCN